MRAAPVLALALPLALACLPAWAQPIVLTIGTESIGEVPADFRGIMAERTRNQFDERGLESAWDAERGDWLPEFTSLTRAMNPTWLRYPGGGEADRSDWRWGITHAPGRLPGRLAQQEGADRFTTFMVGTEEFLALCRALSAEPVLVVNVAGYRDSLQVGAWIAAAWVEYCNAPNDGTNPGGGVDWAAIRAANGHPDPHGVTQWELGNEVWMPPQEMEPEEYGRAIRPHVQAMLEVDPTLEFTAMGQDARWARASMEGVGQRLRWLALHSYSLWEIAQRDVTEEEIWTAAFMGPPDHFSTQAEETWQAVLAEGRQGDVRISLNEWNCNAWVSGGPRPDSMREIQALGAIVFYHELLRRSDHIGQACFSMLVGTAWANTALRIVDGAVEPWPFHRVLRALWTHLDGEIHGVSVDGCPEVTLARQIGNIPPRTKPAIDAIATGTPERLWVSVVNGDTVSREIEVRAERVRTLVLIELVNSTRVLRSTPDDPRIEMGPHSAALISIETGE